MPKYPEVKVKLTGRDGNAFAILGRVSRALKKAGVSKEEINNFISEATSRKYNDLLTTCFKWVQVS